MSDAFRILTFSKWPIIILKERAERCERLDFIILKRFLDIISVGGYNAMDCFQFL